MSTVNELISNIKLAGGFPDDNYFTDAEMLVLMNNELKTQITPLVMKIKEEFFLQDVSHAVSASGNYRIPARCLGNKVRDIKLLNNGSYTNLNRLFEEDREDDPTGYYINRNSITLSSDIETGTLVITYFLAPSTLVLSTSAARVLTIDSATNVTVSALPSSILTSTPVDFVQGSGPYDLLAINQTITSISGTTLTFASLPTDLAVGDYICLAGQAPVVTVPEDLHPVLEQATLAACLQSKKDSGYAEAKKRLEEMKLEIMNMLDTRVESNDIKLRGQGLLTYIRNR